MSVNQVGLIWNHAIRCQHLHLHSEYCQTMITIFNWRSFCLYGTWPNSGLEILLWEDEESRKKKHVEKKKKEHHSSSRANYSSQTELIEAARLQSFITDGEWRRIKCFLYPTANPKIKGAREAQALLVTQKQVQRKGKTPSLCHGGGWDQLLYIVQQPSCQALTINSFEV